LYVRLISLKEKFSFSFVPSIGLMRFNPKDQNQNTLIDDSKTRAKNEEFRNIAISLPLAIQLQYKSNYRVNYTFNLGFLNPQTDYLDNLSQLANPTDKDNVLYYGLGLELLLPTKKTNVFKN
jgi:hypothetical protein